MVAAERNADVVAALAQHRRAVIAGGPRSGKSTIAVRASERYGVPVRHADALVGQLDWSAASLEVSRWLDEPGDWIIEGVSLPRALRKWLAAHPDQPLDFAVIYLREPIQLQSQGQGTMSKGVETVWLEILPELQRRAAVVIDRDQPT